jgi:hypothetical protein
MKNVIIIRRNTANPTNSYLKNLLGEETSKFSQFMLLGLSTVGTISSISPLYKYLSFGFLPQQS